MHARALDKFGQLQNTLFILDGDQQGGDIERNLRQDTISDVPVLFLPGKRGARKLDMGKTSTDL